MKIRLKNIRQRVLQAVFFGITIPLVFGFSVSVSLTAHAAGVPQILSYQGRLTDSAGTLLGSASGTTFYFKFSIYDAVSGGTKLWPTSAPASTSASVVSGVFNVKIGDTGSGYPDALDFNFEDDEEVYLQVEVASTSAGTYEAISPRQRITSAGYAINSKALRGFVPSQVASGSNVPVLSGGNLTLGGTNPQINATGTNDIVIQGGTGTGDLILATNGGNVGVGTSTPATLFSVATSTNIFNVTSAGKVGIGTSTPSFPLQVVVNDSVNTSMIEVRNENSAGGAGINLRSSNGKALQLWQYGADAGWAGRENRAMIYTGALDIFTDYDEALSSGGDFRVHTSGNGNWSQVPNFVITSGRQVGINTTAPLSTLGVSGNLAVGSTYAAGTAAPTNGAIFEGNVGIGTASPSSTLHVASGQLLLPDGSQTNPAIAFGSSQGTGFGSLSSDRMFFSRAGTYNVLFNASGIDLSGDLQYVFSAPGFPTVADAGLAREAAGILRISDGSTGIGGLRASSTTIGANAVPSSTLHVVGTSRFSATSTFDALTVSQLTGTDASKNLTSISVGSGLSLSSGVLSATGDGAGTVTTSSAATAGYFPFWGGASALTGTSTIFASGSYVGIGTTTPTALLHLSGGTGSMETGIKFGAGTTGIYESSADNLTVAVGGVGRWTFSQFLNLSSNAYTGPMIHPTNYGSPTFLSAGADMDTGLGAAAEDLLVLYAGGNNTLAANGANVGIGTLYPSSTAHLIGAQGTAPVLRVQGSQGAGNGNLAIFNQGASTLLTITDQGNLSAVGTGMFNYNGANVGNTQITTNSNYARILGYDDGGSLNFAIGGNTDGYVRTGNFAFGTSTPASLFAVATTTNILNISSSGLVSVNSSTPSGAALTIVSRTATQKGIVLRAASAQTANLFELQGSSGSVLASFDASGDFGVGTSTPQAVMHSVNATAGASLLRLQTDTLQGGYWDSYITFFDGSTYGSLFMQPNKSTGDFAIRDSASNIAFYLDTTSATLGLGDINSYADVDEIFHLRAFSPSIALENTTTSGKYFKVRNGEAATQVFDIYDNSSSTSRLAINGVGNIGIGTIVPSSTLHVVGGFQVGANNLYVSSTSGYVGIGTSTPSTPLYVVGTTTIAGNLMPGANNTYDLGSTSMLWKSLHVASGSIVVHSDMTDTLKYTLDFTGTTARIVSDAATPIRITTGANTGLNIDTAGNVGIGVNGGGALLDVAGTLRVGGNVTANNTTVDTSATGGVLLAGAPCPGATFTGNNIAILPAVAAVPTTNDIFFNTTVGLHSRIAGVTICAGTEKYLALTDAIAGQVAGNAWAVYTPVANIGSAGSGFFNNMYAINYLGLASTLAGGFDVAEQYPTNDESIEAGDVVTMDSSEALFIKKATTGYDNKLVGVISTNPALTFGNNKADNWRKVALTGRVPVKISFENGEIEPGDYLTSSASKPGYAMKMTESGVTVGMALESASGDAETVMMMVRTGYQYVSPTLAGAMSQPLQGQLVGSAQVSQFEKITVRTAQFGVDALGQAEILPGDTVVSVAFTQPYEHKPIVTVTPTTLANIRYAVTETTQNGFKIEIDSAQTEAIGFNWHAFESVVEAKLTVSDGSYRLVNMTVAPEPLPAPEPEPTPANEPVVESDPIIDEPGSETPSIEGEPEVVPEPAPEEVVEEAPPVESDPEPAPEPEPTPPEVSEPEPEPEPAPEPEPTPEVMP